MSVNIPLSSKGNTGKNNVIEDVEYDIDQLPDSYFYKNSARIFDKIYYGKDSVLPSSKFVDLIETLGEGFHSDDMEGHMRKVYPNESISLDYFVLVRWYVDEEVSLESAEEVEFLVGCDCKVRLMGLQ